MKIRNLFGKIKGSLFEQLDAYLAENLKEEVRLEFDLAESVTAGAEPEADDEIYHGSAIKSKKITFSRDRAFGGFVSNRIETYRSFEDLPTGAAPSMPSMPAASSGLEAYLKGADKSFGEALLDEIDARGLKDPDVYNKAQISRQLFGRIKNEPGYRPGKATVVSLLCALELPMPEFTALLERAGYALSPASRFDLIIRWCVEKGIYDIFDINEFLLAHDQPLLGSQM